MNQKYLLGFVEGEGYCIQADVENVASFLARYSFDRDVMIMTLHRYPLLTTSGGFLDRCYDQEYLKRELLPVVLPMQLGEKEPNIVTFKQDLRTIPEGSVPVPDWDCSKGHGIWNLNISKPQKEWRPEDEWTPEQMADPNYDAYNLNAVPVESNMGDEEMER